MLLDILIWQEGNTTAITRLADHYIEQIIDVSKYPIARKELVNGDAFRLFMKEGWKPLSVAPMTTGMLWWKKEVKCWIFIREH